MIRNNKIKTKSSTYGRTPTDAVKEIIKTINLEIKEINSKDIFLDVGSGFGEVVNDFQKIAKINSIGIEKVKDRHEKAIETFPNCNLLLGDIRDYVEILNKATIIYLNDICFNNELIKFCFENASKEAIFICLKATTQYVLINDSKTPLKKVVTVKTKINNMNAKAWLIQK